MIIVNLDIMMAKRKMSLNELSDKTGITLANLSILKNNNYILDCGEYVESKIEDNSLLIDSSLISDKVSIDNKFLYLDSNFESILFLSVIILI